MVLLLVFMQLTRDLFAIAKFLFVRVIILSYFNSVTDQHKNKNIHQYSNTNETAEIIYCK